LEIPIRELTIPLLRQCYWKAEYLDKGRPRRHYHIYHSGLQNPQLNEREFPPAGGCGTCRPCLAVFKATFWIIIAKLNTTEPLSTYRAKAMEFGPMPAVVARIKIAD
jgi:hypothetical protein